jgi:hypothetical protein
MPRGGDLLHERDVRRGQTLVPPEQRVRLLDLGAEQLLKRRYQVRLGRQGAAKPREMVLMRQRRITEPLGVSAWQVRRLAKVIEVVARGLTVAVEVVVGRKVGEVERRWRWLVAAAAAREGVGRWVTVAAGHVESPEPYR